MKSAMRRSALVLWAVLSLGALGAQAAQAHVFESSSANGRTVITGGFDTGFKDRLFSTSNSFKVECTSAVFEGTQKVTQAESTTITPTYGSTTQPSGCEWPSVGAALVHTDHCAYMLHGGTDAAGDASVTIECEGSSENELTITFPSVGVTLHIPPQTPEGGVHYTNAEEGGHKIITEHWTLKNINMTCTPALSCAFVGSGPFDYEGTDVLRGYEDTITEATGTAKTTPSLAGGESAQVNVSVNPG